MHRVGGIEVTLHERVARFDDVGFFDSGLVRSGLTNALLRADIYRSQGGASPSSQLDVGLNTLPAERAVLVGGRKTGDVADDGTNLTTTDIPRGSCQLCLNRHIHRIEPGRWIKKSRRVLNRNPRILSCDKRDATARNPSPQRNNQRLRGRGPREESDNAPRLEATETDYTVTGSQLIKGLVDDELRVFRARKRKSSLKGCLVSGLGDRGRVPGCR